jgi:hypothetical protein
MVDRNKDSDTPDMLLDSFKSLAADKDYITEDDLRRGLSAERVTYLLSSMPKFEKEGITGASYDYKKYVEIAYQQK